MKKLRTEKFEQISFFMLQTIERMPIVQTIRGGLVMTIPVLFVGAFALVLLNLPIGPYQQFLSYLAGGFFRTLFLVIYNATFGVLSIYITIFISISYSKETYRTNIIDWGPIITSLTCFFIFSGWGGDSFSTEGLGPTGMFTALFSTLLSSFLYHWVTKRFDWSVKVYTDGSDTQFNTAFSLIGPFILVVMVFGIVDALITDLFHVGSIYELLTNGFNALFSISSSSFFNGFLFIFLSSFLWFLGIHGSDCLEGVANGFLVPATQANVDAIAQGLAPMNIVNKGLIDNFVFIGGCGSAMCLFIALLLFSKEKSSRSVCKIAAFPLLFNINETIIFGLPIIFNPILFIPFLLTPIVNYLLTYSAMNIGLVPLIQHNVNWTTPVLLSGFTATGSITGSLLQLVNIVVGVMIYAPFVKLLDRQKSFDAKRQYELLVELLQENESHGEPVILSELDNSHGRTAKTVILELKQALRHNHMSMHYQPQCSYNGDYVGVEALLRWDHPLYGMIYPPLVIKLAEEAEILTSLEEHIFASVLKDMDHIRKQFGRDISISINVTGKTIMDSRFLEFLKETDKEHPFKDERICIEVTEQTAIYFNEHTRKTFHEMKALGLSMAIDDFSMGHTSIDYLKENIFSQLKLDGSLVRGIVDQPRYREIIASIIAMASSLEIDVLAEFVETEAQRDALERIGCDLYQGYYFSGAKPLDH